MSNLIKEQRVDKNGVLNTKLVRATPKVTERRSAVPAPSLGGTAPKKAGSAAQKPFRPRPAQVEQQRWALDAAFHSPSPELRGNADPEQPIAYRSVHYVFEASEVEVYSVLSVATSGDAVEMLSKGVRSAEEAVDYMRQHGAGHRIIKRENVAAEALKRGINAYDFITRSRTTAGIPDDSAPSTSMDALELSTISSLSDQYGWVLREVLSGDIRLEDIKYLGATKLKPHRRLIGSKLALMHAHDDDAPYSMEDLKFLVDRAAKERAKSSHYMIAVEQLVKDGVQSVKDAESLHSLFVIARRYSAFQDRWQAISYEAAFRKKYENQLGKSFPLIRDLMDLRAAGVDPEKAAQLINEGLSIRSIIGVEAGGTEKALAEGWL